MLWVQYGFGFGFGFVSVRLLVKNSAVQTISAQRTGTIKVDCMGSAKTNPLVQPCSAVGELTKLTHEVRCKTGQFH